MKYNAMIKRLQRRGFTEQGIASMVAARKKKAAENLAREAVYLGILNEERMRKYQLMSIVSLLKKADVNHANNARDVFVKNILQRKEQHELW